MAENSYSKIVKKHESLKSFVQDSLKNGETAANIGEKICDKFSEINHFNPEVDKFEKGYKPEKPIKLEEKVESYASIETKVEVCEPKVEEHVVEEKPAEIQLEGAVEKELVKAPEQKAKPQEPSEKVYLTIEELTKIPGIHAIRYMQTDCLKKFKKDHKDHVKKNNEKQTELNTHPKKNFYLLSDTLLRYILKEYNKEKAEDIIKNHKKYISDSEEKNLAELIRRIETTDEEIFLTAGELAVIKGARGFCDLESQILLKWRENEKNYRKREVKINQIGGPNPREYRFAPELIETAFRDEEVKNKIVSAYEKRNQKKSSFEDKKIINSLCDGLETLTDEEFFNYFKDGKTTNPNDAKGKHHGNVNILSKKVNYKGKEFEIKYVFKPTEKQDDGRRVGQNGIGYETLSQISQTLADVAASIVDEEFGFELFEKTKIRKHLELKLGSVRRYTDNFISMCELEERPDSDKLTSDVEVSKNYRKAFRYLVNEIDTNNQNWGIQLEKDGKKIMKIIDISQAFGIEHEYNKLNSIKKTPELKEKIMKVDEYLLEKKIREATDKFTDFDEQIEGCIERIRKLKEYLRKD